MTEYIDKSDVNGLVQMGLSGDVIVTAIINNGVSSFPAIPIPKGATNGDTIKAMFPDAEVVEVKYYDGIVSHYQVDFGEVNGNQNIVNFKADLWNAPYKKGAEE